jgi:hypothetical protein
LVPPPHAWQGSPALEALRADAVRIVASEFADSRVSVLKDPRMCRLLPFWRDVLEDAGFTLGAALMVRQPMEVVASLARRDKFAPEKSLVLWLSHVAEAEAGSRGLPRGLVTYDGLLENPDAALTRICDDAGFPLKPTAAHRKAAADLVQPMLKRQQYDAKKADRAAMASGLDKALESGYAMLAELSPGADLPPNRVTGHRVESGGRRHRAALSPRSHGAGDRTTARNGCGRRPPSHRRTGRGGRGGPRRAHRTRRGRGRAA